MADELQPRAVPRPVTAPGELRPDQLPGAGRPPMSQGRTIMTDHTRQQLTAVGWKDGDPIPGDLGARLREIQLEVAAERSKAKLEGSELAAGWKPVAKFAAAASSRAFQANSSPCRKRSV